MKQRRTILFLLLLALLALTGAAVSAQNQSVPQVDVVDQLILGGFVTIDAVYSDGPGYVVIHRASDGGVVGVSQPLHAGWTNNLRINIDTTLAEATMSGMLHVDDNAVGTYEFGTVEGADRPVQSGEAIINTLFNAQVLDAGDQKVVDGSITIKAVAVPVDSWVVVHSGDATTFGGVLGQTLVKAGTTLDVKVAVSGDLTSVLWPMLHIDNGVAGEYEFDGGEIDGPVVMNGAVASFPIWTVNHLRVNDQIAVLGDNMPQMEGMVMAPPSIKIKSVLSEGPGIVVIHANDNGNAGAILGAYFVGDGVTTNLDIQLDTSGGLTPVVWPMLHIDAGSVGTYDGLEVDTVASADGQPVTFTTNAAPALVMADQAIAADGTITIKNAIIDAPGWIAIHSDNNGEPGPVIATALLHTGANWNVKIAVDAAAVGAKVFPMLHYDTNTLGTYEFGTVEGADAPVFVQGNVVVAPLNITQ